MVRSACLVTLFVGAITAVPARAQAPPAAVQPDHYALTNVRIVAAPGRVIERGTVLVRDGRIIAAGPQVTVPATAIRLDLPNHTVYPGLIDAATSLGLPTVGGGGGGGGGGGAPAARPAGAPPAPPQEVMPWREAGDVFYPAENDLAAARNAGFTTLGLLFDGGLFPGRVAAVNTGTNARRVLRTPVAQQVVLGRRRGGYPATLMGALAFVKQSFYDTQYELRVRQAWERQPVGERPSYSADVRGLEAAATGEIPVWFVAEGERDIERIDELAREMGVRNYTIVGAQEGFRVVEDLKRAPLPVVVSLEWREANQVTGRAFELNVAPPSGPNRAQARADSAALRAVHGNPAALARAGVPFALASYGLNNYADARANLRDALNAGLSADDALRALTVTPARLLGIDALVGTIDAGKLANLVVTQGDLFATSARVRYVFVDGIRFDVPVPAPATAQAQRGQGQGQAQPAVIAGAWTGEVDGPTGLLQINLTITESGDSLTGRFASEMGDMEMAGRRTGNELTLNGTVTPPGMTAMNVTITGRVTGDELRGTLTPQGRSAINLILRRRIGGAFEWEGSR
jgi:imidazolonepropionase-like amidohydrolase